MALCKTRIALLGCGYWGKNLLRVLMESHDSRVALVVDSAPAAQGYVKSRYPELPVSDNESDIFDSDSIDAVVIATPRVTTIGPPLSRSAPENMLSLRSRRPPGRTKPGSWLTPPLKKVSS